MHTCGKATSPRHPRVSFRGGILRKRPHSIFGRSGIVTCLFLPSYSLALAPPSAAVPPSTAAGGCFCRRRVTFKSYEELSGVLS